MGTEDGTPGRGGPATITPSDAWNEAIEAFAKIVGLDAEVVGTKLASLTGSKDDEGLVLLRNPADAPDADIKTAFADASVPPAKLNRAIRELRGIPAATPATASATGSAPSMMAMLPQPPDDDSLLEALKVGGVLKVGETEVTAAVRVLLAERLELDGIERRIADAIEARATNLGEPAPDIFYDLETTIGRRSYAEVLKAMGMPGNLVSAGRKKQLLMRITPIFQVMEDFQGRLTAWQEGWTSRISNPGALFAGFAAMMGGGGGANPATAALMEAPDVAPILSAAEGVIDQLNAMFAGTGIPVARALAADAIATRRFLERPEIVSAVGAGSRDEMLKTLGLAVSADLVRAERDATQYILAIMRIQKAGIQQLPGYIIALQQLGAQLPWRELTGPTNGVSPRPGRKPAASSFPGADGDRKTY